MNQTVFLAQGDGRSDAVFSRVTRVIVKCVYYTDSNHFILGGFVSFLAFTLETMTCQLIIKHILLMRQSTMDMLHDAICF